MAYQNGDGPSVRRGEAVEEVRVFAGTNMENVSTR
jgi:hypothetical protein